MGRRRKKKQKDRDGRERDPLAPTPKSAPRVTTGLSSLLKAALAEAAAAASTAPEPPPAPVAPAHERRERARSTPVAATAIEPEMPLPALAVRDLRLLNDAYEGVIPLASAARRSLQRAAERGAARPPLRPDEDRATDEQLARDRLNALVGGGVRFALRTAEDGIVDATRDGVSRRELRRLRSPDFHPEATLDLHGERVAKVDGLVTRFVREHHRNGCRYLLIVHGKGLHSEGRCGVLGEAVLQALTRGGAAPLVRALTHAHPRQGGCGALAIALM